MVPILPGAVIAPLQHFAFYVWSQASEGHPVICLVTSWS